MEEVKRNTQKLSLVGSVSLGTGVMIGAGIFVLMGQIAEFVGDLFPLAFIAGAVVVGFSSYSYVKFSNTYPSSGGIAMFLTKAYGPGIAAGSFSLLMYVSMVVAESLVAGTFGSYTLRLFPQEYAGYASVLGVALIALAYIVNISGNKVIEATATFTAIIKVAGIALLAISGLVVSAYLLLQAIIQTPIVNLCPKDLGLLPHLRYPFSLLKDLQPSLIKEEISKIHIKM